MPPLKAVYSRSQKSASVLAEEAAKLLGLPSLPDTYFDENASGLDALLQRTDITSVIIALPITVQPEIVLRCLSAGKHVLSEKPVAPDVARGVKLLASAEPLCQAHGLVWRVAENFEAEPAYRAAGEVIRSGKIGKIQFFKVSIVNYIDKVIFSHRFVRFDIIPRYVLDLKVVQNSMGKPHRHDLIGIFLIFVFIEAHSSRCEHQDIVWRTVSTLI